MLCNAQARLLDAGCRNEVVEVDQLAGDFTFTVGEIILSVTCEQNGSRTVLVVVDVAVASDTDNSGVVVKGRHLESDLSRQISVHTWIYCTVMYERDVNTATSPMRYGASLFVPAMHPCIARQEFLAQQNCEHLVACHSPFRSVYPYTQEKKSLNYEEVTTCRMTREKYVL